MLNVSRLLCGVFEQGSPVDALYSGNGGDGSTTTSAQNPNGTAVTGDPTLSPSGGGYFVSEVRDVTGLTACTFVLQGKVDLGGGLVVWADLATHAHGALAGVKATAVDPMPAIVRVKHVSDGQGLNYEAYAGTLA